MGDIRIDPEHTFVVSDTHFGHRRTARLRGFLPEGVTDEDAIEASRVAQDEALIAAWNSVVGPTDHVFHAGDVTFRRAAESEEIFARLNGHIRILPGNHDESRLLRRLVGSDNVLDSIVTLKWGPTAHERVVVSHYPLAAWEGAEQGTPHVHGHLHTGLNGHRHAAPNDQMGIRRDIGVDTADHIHGQARFAPIPLLVAIR